MYGYFDDEKHVYLLMELCADGQLYEILKDKRRLSEEEARPMIRQLCEAVDYLHRNDILHRDIKPENVLIQNVLFC
jgi:serine/threonine protein kinase